MTECDNINECHYLEIVAETHEALRAFCLLCKNTYIVRKDEKGSPERREYAKLFKRDILQPSENLYYKYHPEKLAII